MESITATRAARHFSDLLNRVAYRHETLEISRGGRAVARLTPVAPKAGIKLKDLNKLLAHLPGLDDDATAFATDVETAAPEPEGDAWESQSIPVYSLHLKRRGVRHKLRYFR